MPVQSQQVLAEDGFPRLYAAASLKPDGQAAVEAGDRRFPRLYAAASLKHLNKPQELLHAAIVFRGFMPRPH